MVAQFMQRILRDLERERKAIKHGATLVRVPLSEKNAPMEEYTFDFLAFDMALEALEKLDARQVAIVKLRFFADLSVEEIAETLDISAATVKRDLKSAKAFLLLELNRNSGSG